MRDVLQLRSSYAFLSTTPSKKERIISSITDNDFRTLDINDYDAKDKSGKDQRKSGIWGI